MELNHEQAVEQLSKVIGEYVDWYLGRMAELVGHPHRAVPTVEELTGRPGTTFAQWAVRNADSFR